jgi:iron complex transport system substrate-binding protein
VFAAGAGDALVGVVEYSDFPVDALDVPLIGRFDRFDIETILALKPDLVLAWQTGNPRATVERLASLGLTVYVAEPKVLGSIPALIETIGTLADTRSGRHRSRAFSSTLARTANTLCYCRTGTRILSGMG